MEIRVVMRPVASVTVYKIPGLPHTPAPSLNHFSEAQDHDFPITFPRRQTDLKRPLRAVKR